MSIMKKDVFLRDQLQTLLKKMNYILASSKVGKVKKEDLESLNELNAKKNEYTQMLKDNIREQEIISKIVEESRNAEIRVEQHVYKGAIIAIDASRMPIQDNTQYMIYRGNNGVIEGSVIIVN